LPGRAGPPVVLPHVLFFCLQDLSELEESPRQPAPVHVGAGRRV
jgi:hypothetical protein